jgi:hypothetical protein
MNLAFPVNMSGQTIHGKRHTRRLDKYKAAIGISPTTLLSIAERCAKTYHFHQKLDGPKHKAVTFWEVIVFAMLFNLSTRMNSGGFLIRNERVIHPEEKGYIVVNHLSQVSELELTIRFARIYEAEQFPYPEIEVKRPLKLT